MKPIVEHVKRAIVDGAYARRAKLAGMSELIRFQMESMEDTFRAEDAIRATLEYARERAKFNDPAVDAILDADLDIYWGYYSKGPGGPDDVARVFIDALLAELDGPESEGRG